MKVPRCLALFTLVAGGIAAPVKDISKRQDVGAAVSPVVGAVTGLLGTLSPLLGGTDLAGVATCLPSDATSSVDATSVSSATGLINGLTQDQAGEVLTALLGFVQTVQPLIPNLAPVKRQANLDGLVGGIVTTINTALGATPAGDVTSTATSTVGDAVDPVLSSVTQVLGLLPGLLGAVPGGSDLAGCITSELPASVTTATGTAASLGDLLAPVLKAVEGLVAEVTNLLSTLTGGKSIIPTQ